jgi:hypothetical protein
MKVKVEVDKRPEFTVLNSPPDKKNFFLVNAYNFACDILILSCALLRIVPSLMHQWT